MTWLAVKEFCKQAWKFVVDQWLFFVAAVIGIAGFIAGARGGKNTEKVLELQRKSEEEERQARTKAKEEAETVLKKLDEDLSKLKKEERKEIEKIREAKKEEFDQQVIDNRDKPLDEIAKELAEKYGLNKV